MTGKLTVRVPRDASLTREERDGGCLMRPTPDDTSVVTPCAGDIIPVVVAFHGRFVVCQWHAEELSL